MKIQKMIVTLLLGAILLPSVSFAQTTAVTQPTRDELVMKLIASLMEQIKVLQAQLVALKEKEAQQQQVASTTTPKPLDTFVSERATLSGSTKEYSQQTPTATGKYTSITAQEFEITAEDSSAALTKVVARISATENVKVTKAYLYQGDSVPLASATVVNGVATFVIPPQTTGSSFGSDIPAKFTIKVDVSGVDFSETNKENKLLGCKGDCDGYTYTARFTPFIITSTIKSSDIQLQNNLGQIFKTITGSASAEINVTGYTCTGIRCA